MAGRFRAAGGEIGFAFVLNLTFHDSICQILVAGILINYRPGAVHHQIGREIATGGRSMNPVPFETAFAA